MRQLAAVAVFTLADESLIALDLVDTLQRLGADEVRAVSTEPEACVLLERCKPSWPLSRKHRRGLNSAQNPLRLCDWLRPSWFAG
jgi:hypothetical protein